MANLKTGGLRQLLEGLVAQRDAAPSGAERRHPTSPVSGRGANLRPGPRSSERRARGWLGRGTDPAAGGHLGRAPLRPGPGCPRTTVGSIIRRRGPPGPYSSPGGAGGGRARAGQEAGHAGRAARRGGCPAGRSALPVVRGRRRSQRRAHPPVRAPCALTAARCLSRGPLAARRTTSSRRFAGGQRGDRHRCRLPSRSSGS